MKGGEVQDLAAAAIREHFPGIERGRRKRDRVAAGEPASAVINRSVRQLHQDLPGEIAAAEAALATAAGRAREMGARVAKLEARHAELGELAVREARRLETYTARLHARRGELEEANRELVRVTAVAAADQAEAERVREAARTETAQAAALTCAVEVVSSELVRPAPEPGKWLQGRFWNADRWGEVRRRLAVPWTTPAWTVVRTVAGLVAALAGREATVSDQAARLKAEREAEHARFRRHAALIHGWVDTIADRLGLATADPAAIAAAVAELDEPANDLPSPSPFDDRP